jgi:hypothetical protein
MPFLDRRTLLRHALGVVALCDGVAPAVHTVWHASSNAIRAVDYGMVADGVTDAAPALDAAIQAALKTGIRRVQLPKGKLIFASPRQFEYQGQLELVAESSCTFVLNAGSPSTLSFAAKPVCSTALAKDAVLGATSIVVADATGLAPGQLVYLSTTTAVDYSYHYKKQAALKVRLVDGETIFLSAPLNFPFAANETTAHFRQYASIHLRGVHILVGADANYRLDFAFLQDCTLSHCTFEGRRDREGDVLFLSAIDGLKGTDLELLKGRYTINVSNASRNLLFEDILARDNRHPIDCNTWAYNTIIRRMRASNTENAIECHPCFETHFEDCSDVARIEAAIGLRCVGGSAKRCRVRGESTGNKLVPPQGAFLSPEYRHIGQSYDRVYEDIISEAAVLSAMDTRSLIVRRCAVANIACDGLSDRVDAVDIDSQTTISPNTDLNIRRVKVIAQSDPLLVEPYDEFAAIAAPIAISRIGPAPNCVVTAVRHGFLEGEFVAPDTAGGNLRVFAVKSVTADTFQLESLETADAGSCPAGTKAVKVARHRTINPRRRPGLGWYPSLRCKAVVADDLPRKRTAERLCIPFKLRTVWGIHEQLHRTLRLTLSAADGHRDGAQALIRYGVDIFTGAPSRSTLTKEWSSPIGNAYAAVIEDLRPHYYTEVKCEGGNPDTDIADYYLTFNVCLFPSRLIPDVSQVILDVEEMRG